MYHFHFFLLCADSLLAFNSGSRGTTEVISGERKIGNSKILQRRYKLINLSLPRDSAGMYSADQILNVSSFIFYFMNPVNVFD